MTNENLRRHQASAGPERSEEQPGNLPRRWSLWRPGPPYIATAAILLGTIALSQALPWARRAFGGNVPPLFARLSPAIGVGIAVPLLLMAVAWAMAPRIQAARPAVFLFVLVVFGWIFAIALAGQSGGSDAVTAPFRRPIDYYANVPLVQALGPRAFAERFPDLGGRLSLHASTHPPGAPLLLWGLSKAFGGSLLAVSSAVALIGVAGTVPTYLLAKSAYGERVARVAAALFVASPGVLLFSATSMDAVFMTVTAFALAAAVRAPTSDGWAVAAGALSALALVFTFGAAAVGLVALGAGLLSMRESPVLALVRRAALTLAGLVGAALILKVAIGIDLLASFGAALDARSADPAYHARPYGYWLIANFPAFLLSAGIPQTALLVRETRRRWRRRQPGLESVLWASLAVASLTGLFRGEVDHIWLFFVPLVAASAGAALLEHPPPVRGSITGDGSPRTVRVALLAGLAQAVLMEVLLITFW